MPRSRSLLLPSLLPPSTLFLPPSSSIPPLLYAEQSLSNSNSVVESTSYECKHVSLRGGARERLFYGPRDLTTLKSYLVRFLVSGRPRGNSASRLEHITGPTTPAAAEMGAYYYIGATQPAFMGNAQSRLHLRMHRNGRTTPATLYTCRNTAIRSGIDCQARCACCNSSKTILRIRPGTSLLHTTPHNEQTLRPVWDRPAAGKARV